ncbi:SAM-dependent methyltransferase [Streptomyces avicenniae]|uniref:SAM-dependent methyltransferase n=1 Tax=Streptomyces avicenniae TaxID=500153 RepID=UPI00069ADE96
MYKKSTANLTLRTHPQVSGFFAGFDLLDPGIVQAPFWRPERSVAGDSELGETNLYAAVGFKP